MTMLRCNLWFLNKESFCDSKGTIADLQRELTDKLAEIEQLKSQLAILKRQQFGRSSEKVKRTIQYWHL